MGVSELLLVLLIFLGLFGGEVIIRGRGWARGGSDKKELKDDERKKLDEKGGGRKKLEK